MKTAVKETSLLTAQDIRQQVEQDPGVIAAARRLDLARAKFDALQEELDIQTEKLYDLTRSGDTLAAELLRLAEQGTVDRTDDPAADINAKISSLHRQISPWQKAIHLAERELTTARQAVVSKIYADERREHKEILKRQLAKAAELAIELKAEEDFCQKYAENSFPLGRESFTGVSALQGAFSPTSALRAYCDVAASRDLLTNDDIPQELKNAWREGR